jgi:dipeptidyl aminopeptidase/acylaminoacyl peptidase
MRRLTTTTTLVLALVITPALLRAQAKHPPARQDWGQFENLAVQPRGGLSPDGKWLVYGINRSNRNNELRIRNLETGKETTVAFGAQPAFSADSKWIAYSIGYSEEQEERMRTQRRPVHRKLGLLKLDGSSEPVVIDGIEAFSFDPSGAFIVMRRYAPERQQGGGSQQGNQPPAAAQAQADAPAPTGVTILVRELETGRDTTFGNVAEYAWQNVRDPRKLKGRLLAFTVSTEDKTGNGIHLYDAATRVHRVLDSSASVYTGLAWREDADDLVVLRSQTDDTREGSTHAVLAWTGVSSASPVLQTLDPLKAVPAVKRIVSFRRPSWSDDGRTLYVGVGAWEEKPLDDTKKPSASGDDTPPARPAANDDMPSLEIWHARDVTVMPRQKITARSDRQRNFLHAWHLGSDRLVELGRGEEELVIPIRKQKLAYATVWDRYAMDRSIGRPAADFYLVDVETGERTKIVDRIDDAYLQVSPTGRFVLFLKDDAWWTINTATQTVTNISKSAATSFIDRESDSTARQKPHFGIGGWTPDDNAVLLYDKFDVWEVAADGSRATRLTNGASDQVRHRIVRLDPDADAIDTSRPVMMSLFGTWSKKSGYGRWNPSSRTVERLIFDDRQVSSLAKAAEADVYVYVTQRYDDSPDAYVGGPDLAAAKQVTNTNAFMSKYAWGRSAIVEFKSDRGVRLQGALFYPAGYEPGKKYPMVVYLYEKLSDGVHRFVPPSEREYYNASAFTTQGYFFFQPDIVFRPREPGLSVRECVEPAVKKVISMGLVDPARIGVIGHSWGGFDAAYLATHSTMFAAAVAGAAITNLVSNYGNHHWSSGIAETDHIETGQQRMEVPIYEDLQAYIRNSPVFNVHNMKTPLLLEVGDNDGTVHWHQGVELYNIARRAKKDVVMLVYGGEDHGLRRRANQIDYQKRIHEWFAHYLKGEPAASWITSGLRYVDREKELKKSTTRKGS